jgi:tetratricopeptide (TPR) repeat protein
MEKQPVWWRRWLALSWFAWGQSTCYWANRFVSHRLYDQAIAAYGRALIYWPTFARAYLRRGIIKGRELDDYSGAIRDLSQAIELLPEWPEPYLQRGLFHRFHAPATAERAIDDLQRYLELAPSASSWRFEAERQITLLQYEILARQNALRGT